MKTATTLSFRIRLAFLKGVARLLTWAIAPALKPATINAGRSPHESSHRGRVIDGEYRRISERNTTTPW